MQVRSIYLEPMNILLNSLNCRTGGKRMNKTSIIILTYNNLEYSKACIDSIRKYTEAGTYEIVIIDNNSDDGTKEWLLNQQDIKLKLNDENVGFPRGCNMGIELAEPGNDILLLNNDTIVTARWLENLRKCLYSSDDIGAAGAVSLSTANLQGVEFTYDNFDDMQRLAEKNNISDSSKWEEKLKLIGFCLLLRRASLDQVGRLDEMFSPGYYEDDDLGLKLIEAGYKLMLCHDVFIHHYLGTSFRKDPNKFWSLLNENQVKFTNKWGFSTLTFDELRGDLEVLIDEKDKNKEIKVLEMGCKLGVNLLRIKYKFPKVRLYGTETNVSMAKIAERIGTIYRCTPWQLSLKCNNEKFDYIIIGNTLENIDDMRSFLISIKSLLKINGYLIAGFQNIMHYSVIRELINGNWLYTENKIINKTNKYMFTANDICSLFNECGYQMPYIFHWYSWTSDEDERYISFLSSQGGKEKEYLYRTYEYAVRVKRNIDENEVECNKNEIKYMLRRIENGIEKDLNKINLMKLIDEGVLGREELKEIIESNIIQKEFVKKELGLK